MPVYVNYVEHVFSKITFIIFVNHQPIPESKSQLK